MKKIQAFTGLFILTGAAGGLERGTVSFTGAMIYMVIAIVLLLPTLVSGKIGE